MSFPTPEVSVAFVDAPWYTGGPTFTNITSKVQRIRISTGRSKDLDPFPPGVAAVDLDNSDRSFDPEYSAGPYFGNLTANKKLRIQMTYLGVTYPIYWGFVDGWPQDYMPPKSAVCSLTAADMLKRMAKATPTWDIYADEVRTDTPRVWWRLGEKTGSSYGDFSGNGYTLFSDDIGGVPAGAVDGIIQADNGALKLPVKGRFRSSDANPGTGTTMSVEFWIKGAPTPLTSIYTPPLHENPPDLMYGSGILIQINRDNSTLFGPMGSFIWYWPGASGWGHVASAATVLDERIHHVVITRSGNTNIIYIDGADRTLASSKQNAVGATTNIAGDILVNNSDNGEFWQDGPIIDEVAIYTQTLTADRVLAHYQAGSAPWDGDSTGFRVMKILDRSHYPWVPGWGPTLPWSGLFGVDDGLMTLGPASWSAGTTALALLDQTEQSELGYVYVDHTFPGSTIAFKDRTSRLRDTRSITSQATISDNPATSDMRYSTLVGTYDQAASINSVTVKWAGGTAFASDSASITANGESGLSIDTNLRSLVDAQYFADGLLRRYKTPIGRFDSITIYPTTDALWVEVLTRRIGDRITVRRHPQGVGTAITFDCIVEGIDYEFDDGVDTRKVTYHLSRADPTAYWILDTSALESTAILAF